MFAPVSRTLYIKNSDSFFASAENKIGDLSNTIIPPINVPQNITEDFAGILTQQIISKNSEPKAGESSEPKLTVPDVNVMAESFVANGLKQANKNILNIKAPNLKISYDNSKTAIENYLSDTQTIINNNLKTDVSLYAVLDEINKNNGAGLEKLLPIIAAHETAANQLEEKPVPSNLKDLMIEEIRLLRVTANVFRALTNIENDPLGGMTATQQFSVIMQSWNDLQIKMNEFLKKFNRLNE